MIVLALNGGSSNVKFALYRTGVSKLQLILSGHTDGDSVRANLVRKGEPIDVRLPATASATAIDQIAALVDRFGLPQPDAIGHRVVHGGPNLRTHCLIDDEVRSDLEGAVSMSPLHGPMALEMIAQAGSFWPTAVQVACLDTAFHAQLPEMARTIPIAKVLRSEGVRRYGFHGISCESVVRQLGPTLPPRLIIAHLGGGCSVTAVQYGHSLDTSMGLTPTGGAIMGSRSGDLDPGLLIYLMRLMKLGPDQLERLLDNSSGLLGISERSSDMRELHAFAPRDAKVRLAIDMFCVSVAKLVASMTTVMGGVDTIVFTGGIGENDDLVRTRICSHLSWMGVELDSDANRKGLEVISSASACRTVRVVSAKEETEIARHTSRLARVSRPEPTRSAVG